MTTETVKELNDDTLLELFCIRYRTWYNCTNDKDEKHYQAFRLYKDELKRRLNASNVRTNGGRENV